MQILDEVSASILVPENITPDYIPASLIFHSLNDKPYIGLELINKLNDLYKAWNKVQIPLNFASTIRIDVSRSVSQIDLLNIGMIAVFKAKYFRTEFIFNFEAPHLEASALSDNPSNDVFFKLLHYAASAYLFSGIDLFSLKAPNHGVIRYSQKNAIRKETWFAVPDPYLPVILLNPLKYASLFERPFTTDFSKYITLAKYNFEERGQNNSDIIYQNLRRNCIHSTSFNWENFTVLYYYKFLAKFNLLHVELFNSAFYRKNKTKLGGLTTLEGKIKPWNWREIDTADYYSKASVVLREIKDRPAIFIQLFSIIAVNLFNQLSGIFRKTEISAILEKSVHMTEDIFTGLRELARNTVEHSGTRTGIFIARVFNKQTILELKQGGLPRFDRFISSDPSTGIYLDLNLLDIGEKGITDTIPSTLELKLEREDLDVIARKQLQEDILKIRQEEVGLEQLLMPGISFLNHQSSRAISSIGLQIFSNRVNSYNAYFFMSTPIHKKRAISIAYFHNQVYKHEQAVFYEAGTLYNVIFPLKNKRKEPFRVEENPRAEDPAILTGEFGMLLQFQYHNNIPDTHTLNPNKKHIVRFPIQEPAAKNKYLSEYENVKPVIEYSMALQMSKNTLIPLLDCSAILNSSTLYRILSGLQFLHNINDIICINLKDSLFRELINIIEITGVAGGFWENTKTILFYVSTVTENNIPIIVPALITGNSSGINHYINEQCARKLLFYFPFNSDSGKLQSTGFTVRSPLVDASLAIHNLDLIISDNFHSIYENNVKALLNSPVLKK